MKKKRFRLQPFRIAAVLLGAFALAMLFRFPSKSLSIENQQKQLREAANLYANEQARNERLNAQIAEINTPDFVERMARRKYGYSWYGETVYEVGNFDEVTEVYGFEISGE